MDVAIKFEKLDLGDDRFIFKPVSIIKGNFVKESSEFLTDYGEVCSYIHGLSAVEDSYFGALTTMDELKEMYKDDSEENLLAEYYNVCNSYYWLGFYDYTFGKISVINIPCAEIEQAMHDLNEQKKLELQSSVEEKAEKNSQEIDADVEIVIGLEKLISLRNTKDIKSIHEEIDKMIEYALGAKELVMSGKVSEKNGQYEVNPNEEKQKHTKIDREVSKVMTLQSLRKEVKDVIKGQDVAVDDVTRAIIVNQQSTNPRHKSHMLIIGPSGTGKTEMINIITKKLGIPYYKADATAYTKEGYIGKSVYSMFNGLVDAAGGDIEKAQNGILVIDEIDKKVSTKSDDATGTEVLNSLLKVMDREKIEVDVQEGAYKRTYLFDTSNLTIIFMGAFANIYKEKEEKLNKKGKKSIGFGNVEKTEEKSQEKIVITNEDLIKAGMPPEFLGRIPVITNTEELDVEDLVEILYKSKGGVIEEEKEFCRGMGITLKFTSPFMREIAKKAYESKTGARNLRKLVRQSLANAYDEVLLTKKEVKVLKLTKETAKDPKKYYIEYM